MKRINLIFFIALLLFGCAKEDLQGELPSEDSKSIFTAEFADIVTDNELKQYWEKGDKISLFSSSTNQEYVFNGESGSTSATFEPASVLVDNQSKLSTNYAVYPYSSSNTIVDGKLNITLPAMQSYVANSLGTGANSMVAVTSDINDRKLSFKHLCGFLKLNMYGEAAVKSIVLKGNNNEKIAGKAVVTASYGSAPSVVMSDDATTTITIDCGTNGVELGKTEETQTTFWVVVPPVKFTEGYSITITTSDGTEVTKATSNSFEVMRTKPNEEETLNLADIMQPANQIWYTSTDGSVVVPSSSDDFGAKMLSNTYTNGKGVITFDTLVTSIGMNGFSGCSNLASIKIPEGVTHIQPLAFRNCTNLSSVEISEGCEIIGMMAFDKCTSLSSITLPESMTTLETGAFQNCTSLKSMTIPNKVKTITQYLFNKCTNLTTVVIPEGVTTIDIGAFNQCSSLKSVRIPESMNKIMNDAFNECFNVKFSGKFASDNGKCLIANSVLIAYSPGSSTASGIKYTIPSGVKSIGEYAFFKCTQISSVVIPEGVTSILANAFMDCANLKSVTIPSSVTQIGSGLFNRCTSLENVYCYPTNPPTLESTSAFNKNAENRLIHVPKASESQYKGAAVWSAIEKYIVGDL